MKTRSGARAYSRRSAGNVLGQLLRQRRQDAGVSRERFASICASIQGVDEGILDEWYKHLETGGRIFLAGWELRLLAAAFRRLAVALTWSELLAAADYTEADYSGSSPMRGGGEEGENASTVSA